MSNETTRRGAGRGHVGEAVLEEELPPSAPERSRDEDAEAFLHDASEAAAAAALEAEALAAEIDADAGPGIGEPLPAAEDGGAEAPDDAGALRPDAEPDPLDAGLEAALGEAAEARAFAEAPDEEGAERAAAAAFDEEAALRADRELAEEAQTPEEQALAQDERDPEDDVAPAEIAELEEEASASLEKLAAKARRLTDDQARNVIHSLLFVADRPLTIDHLRQNTGLEPKRIQAALDRLSGELREGVSGVVLSEVAGGWQLRTAPESAEFVRRFLHVKPRRLTRAALETLAIIAYRQPVTRPEVEDIRGVDSGAVVKALLEWKLIKILGKKDEVGRPLLYGTTREFLEFFQLKDLASLPTLREFQELNEESRQIVEEELGPEAAASIAGTLAELGDPAYLEQEKERIAKSEQALAELEQALADAEQKSADVEGSINPPKAAEPEEQAAGDEG